MNYSDLSNKGFGVKVFDEKMDTVFKGTSPQETFLLLTVTGEDNSGKDVTFQAILIHIPCVLLPGGGHEIISPHYITYNLSLIHHSNEIHLQSLWLPTGISLLTSPT